MVKLVICGTLGLNTGQIRGELACGHRLSISQGNHTINRNAGADIRPVKRLQQRLGQGKAGGFDQNMIRLRVKGHQRFNRRNKIICHRTADTAIGQFHNIFSRTFRDRTAFQNFAVDAHITEFIDNHSQTLALRILHQLADQCCFSRT